MSDDNVPAAIRRKQEQAEAARKKVYEAETPTEPAEVDPEAVEPQADATPTPPEPEPDEGVEPDTDTDWKAKYEALVAEVGSSPYRTLKGKYDAEVPRLAEQLRQAKEQLETANSEIASLKAAGNSPASGTGDAEVDAKIESVRSEYGDEMVEVITAVASRLVSQATEQHVKPLNERVEQVQETQETSAKGSFYATLDSGVENWRAINADPKFHDWLAQVDPLTGEERQTSLERAYGRLDAERVKSIFKLFLEHTGASATPDPGAKGDEALSRQVTPDTKGTTTRTPQEPKVYSKSDVDKLAAQARSGEITDEQYRSGMGEIHKAINEGRYRPA